MMLKARPIHIMICNLFLYGSMDVLDTPEKAQPVVEKMFAQDQEPLLFMVTTAVDGDFLAGIKFPKRPAGMSEEKAKKAEAAAVTTCGLMHVLSVFGGAHRMSQLSAAMRERDSDRIDGLLTSLLKENGAEE